MKHKMNQVTPKAGTLKQANEIQNALRKLISSVLMLAVLVMNPGSIMASIKAEDSCCETPTKKLILSKTVLLTLPSTEMLRKADREMTINLYKSLKESKVKKFAHLFKVSDAEVNALFISETTIGLPIAVFADEGVNDDFAAENLSIADASDADTDINDLFTAEEAGIKQSSDLVNADEQMSTMFHAENIRLPGEDNFAAADREINKNMNDELHVKLVSNN